LERLYSRTGGNSVGPVKKKNITLEMRVREEKKEIPLSDWSRKGQ